MKLGFNVDSMLERLIEREDIRLVNKSYVDRNGFPLYITETFVANFETTTSQAQIDSMNHVHNVTVSDTLFADPRWLLLSVTKESDRNVLAMGNLYHESDLVRLARANIVISIVPLSDPNDSLWSYQWNFKNTGQNGGTPDADIDLDLAREYAIPASTSLIVAIIDDGLAVHEDFPSSRFIGGFDYFEGDFDYSPGRYASHGMGCLGLLSATQNNSYGMAGINEWNRVMPLKIANANGEFLVGDATIGLAFSDAIVGGARVISCSWGCLPGADCGILETVSSSYWIRKADSAGVLVLFGAGNHGGALLWPAYFPEVVTVGASDKRDDSWLFSANGPEVDIVAPTGLPDYFGDVWTLDQMADLGLVPTYIGCVAGSGSYNCKFGGTSAACPQAAGVAALVLQRRPDLVGNTAMLKKILRYSSERTPFGKPPTDTARVDDFVGWGRLNAARALLAVVCGDADSNESLSLADATLL